jgi:hypothetical protein
MNSKPARRNGSEADGKVWPDAAAKVYSRLWVSLTIGNDGCTRSEDYMGAVDACFSITQLRNIPFFPSATRGQSR